jgi:hypothetical protein
MIDKIAGAAVQGANQAAQTPKVQSFGKALDQAKPGFKPASAQQAQQAQLQNSQAPTKPAAAQKTQGAAPISAKPQAAQLLNEVSSAQHKLDQILKMAESGRTFSPAELLAFQAHAYRASQELDLAGKVVEKATEGAKQTLNTQV